MKLTKSINSSIARWSVFSALVALFGSLAGCSSMVDAPSSATAPENDVRNYYIQMATPKVIYNYTVASTAPFHPASGTLAMSMSGIEDTKNGTPIYACLWSYKNYGTPTDWFYSVSDKAAINLGLEDSSGQYTDNWVDLQSPLAQDKSWTFTSHGEQITATIVKYGATAQVEGQTYDNVLMVNYVGVNGTNGTEWFQRGKGIIYSHIEYAKFGMVENHLLSIVQP